MATKKELMKKMAELETINDQLMAEVIYVDRLMRVVGFSDGLQTVKETAQDIINEGEDAFHRPDENFGDDGLQLS